MMQVVSLKEYFNDAPHFQQHEGLKGAKYRIKDHPRGAGLWFAKEAMTLEIVSEKIAEEDEMVEVNGLDEFPATRAEGLRKYDVRTVDVQPNDAVIDYFMALEETRRPAKDVVGESRDEFWEHYHRAGALVQFHIPRDEFNLNYIYDDVGQSYRTKPYQVKFVPEDVIIRTDGNIEPVKKNSTVMLKQNCLSIHTLLVFSGLDERVICGQPLRFYTREAYDHLGKKRDVLAEMASLAEGLSLVSARGKVSNPYRGMKDIFSRAADLFRRAPILSPQQRHEFNAHVDDLTRRFYYFEAHPIEP